MNDPGPRDPDPGAAQGLGHVLVGRYRVERVLGRGGMGEVLLAHDTLLHRAVALKHLRADGAQAADRRSAILKEARRAIQVSDHRIAAIHDVLDLGDDVLLVMEYVEGETLREKLGAPFTLETFWRLSGECVEGLRAAHAKGVIHRDIKPENLMLTRDQEIKILDFGIALRSERHAADASPDDSTSSVEQARRPAGTPRYMAPEAHYGGHIDERTDIFSLGAVFYEMLTARHPFAGGGFETLLDHIMNTVPEPVSRLNPAVSEALSGVIERMLARDPAQRYASCDELAAALRTARAASADPVPAARTARPEAATLPATASPIETPKPVPRPRHAARLLLIVLGSTLSVFAWRACDGPGMPTDRNLALLLPATPGGDPEFAAFALGTVELLATRLQRHQDLRGFQLAPFSESRRERLATVPDARKLLGANLALVSTLEPSGNSLAARLELRESAHGRRLGGRRIVVPQAEPIAFGDSLYRAALALLGLPTRRPGAVPDVGVHGAGTLRFLAQGIGRAESAQSEADFAQAREDLETACQMEPDAAIPRAWLATAQLLTSQRTKDAKWLEQAEASARRAVALDSAQATAQRVLGEVLLHRKRPAESLRAFERACALDPTRDDAWMGYARCYWHLGEAERERGVYRAAIERRPHAFRPRWWLAQWEYQQGHLEAAIAAYRQMIGLAPAFSRGYASLGAMLVLRGDYAAAIDTLRLALALRPNATAYTNLGTAYFNTGLLNECVAAYNQAFQFGEAGYAHWLNLGDAYFWLKGRPDQARDAYLRAVSLGREALSAAAERGEPADPMTCAQLASVFPKLGEPDSARIYLGRATAADSTNMMVQYCAALTLWQIDERPQALDWLERAVAGGYPRAWIRDSPVHRDWRTDVRFTALLADAGTASPPTQPPNQEEQHGRQR